jgi:integrase
MTKWVKLEKGIRYWTHPDRKFKSGSVNRRDRYFAIRFTVRGKSVETGLGWESEGVTVDDCRERLRQFKTNARQANGQPTMMKELFSEDAASKRQNILIKDFIKTHYLQYIAGIKSATQARKEGEHCSKWIIPTIGDKRLNDLQDKKESGILGIDVVLILKNTLVDAGKAPRTVELVLSTLQRIYQHAEKLGIVQGKLEYSDVKKSLMINNARQRFLTREEAERLLSMLRERDQTLADMAEFSLLTACRQGELFNITWQDVSIETKSILLKDTKNKSDRNLYLTDRAVEIIQKQPTGKPQDAVFRDESGDKYIRLPRGWDTILRRSGLNEGIIDNRLKVCWHSLRHTSASWLAEAGVDLYKVAKVLGHRDLRMTQRYSHLSEQSIRDAVEKVMGGQP